MNFSGKVAAITGAASGIGRHLTLELARLDCKLAISDINAEGLRQTAEMVKELRPVELMQTVLDVANKAEVEAWAEEVEQHFGKVNFIFNNAGVAYGATVEAMPLETFEWLFNINFWGVVHGTQAFLPRIKRAGEGHIINISSIFGLMAIPGQAAYNVAKFAVRAYTLALRQELEIIGSPVSATVVHPGGIKTNIANAAKLHPSVAELGIDVENATANFNKLLVTPPKKAALIIINGIRKNKRRVFVGTDAHIVDRLVRYLPNWHDSLIIVLSKLQAKRGRKKSLSE